jgi:hypothetical protein
MNVGARMSAGKDVVSSPTRLMLRCLQFAPDGLLGPPASFEVLFLQFPRIATNHNSSWMTSQGATLVLSESLESLQIFRGVY